MILGIIFLIMLIVGFATMVIAVEFDCDWLRLTSIILIFIGFIGIDIFIRVNSDLIIEWFKC